MFQDKLKEIIEQPKQAALWCGILTLIPFLHWFAILLMLVVTLRKGWREGLLLAVIVAILSGISAKLMGITSHTQLALLMTNPILLWLLGFVLYETRSWQLVLITITIVGIILVIAAFSLFPESTQYWTQGFITRLQQFMADHPNLMGNIDANDAQSMLQIFGQFATGLRIMLLMTVSLISVVMGRYIQASLYNPGGLRQELYQLHLNYIFTAAVIILIVIACYIKTSIWLSFIPVLTLAFTCAGLSLLHWYTARYRYQLMILIVFYVCVATILPQLLLAIMLIGILDSFINFRNRFVLKR